MIKSKIFRSTLVGAAAVAAVVLTPGLASADEPNVRVADPSLYCYDNPPFQLQVGQAGWSVYSGGHYDGSWTQNNMRCVYEVSVVVPTGEEGFTLPPVRTYTKVDWRTACAQQFPGSTLVWTGGGWRCRVR